MQHGIDDIAELRRRGYRLTSQRLLVLQVIRESPRFLTAEEIYAAVVPQHPALDIATVYRTLHWLQKVGLIAPIDITEGRQRFEYHQSGADHHHLICERCGTHTHIPHDMVTALRETIRANVGFSAHLHHLVLSGVCAHCQKNQHSPEGQPA
ncbi:MAG: Fur family transcriptional regulator [Roseiflexaceae bacterium]